MTSATGRRGGWGIPLVALAAVVLGVALVARALVPQPEGADAPASVGTIDPQTPAASSPASLQPPLPLSPPRELRIPAIDVDTPVNPIGKNPDGTLAVPQPGPELNEAAWFDQSPSPGQPGPAIIEGHVDTAQGDSVFHDLAALRPGDRIEVTREDGIIATFTVDALRDVEKSSFPTKLVYGAKDLGTPSLRLITCSMFDPDIGTHVGNTVVFATLTDVTHP